MPFLEKSSQLEGVVKENLFSQLRLMTGMSIQDLCEKTGYSTSTLYRWERGEGAVRPAVVSQMEQLAKFRSVPTDPEFRFIDLFAGIGGLRRGFEPLGGKCVFTSEWNTYSQLTYCANHVCDHEVAGDITAIDARDIPAHDLLLGGFPCQPFSIAGVSKKNSLNRPHGFHDEAQGTLFFDVARILEYHRPRAFLLENVKNLLSHDRGRTFDVIRRTLEQELGYTVHARVVDARSWVPQHRERIMIVGFRDTNHFTLDDLPVPDPTKGPKLESILHNGLDSGPISEADKKFVDARGRVLPAYTLSDKLWNYLQSYAEKHRAQGNGFGCSVVGPGDVTRTLSARYYKDGSEILVRQKGNNPRRLTPRECSRLMGFDKPNTSDFMIPVSDTQAYKQFGNAVVVPVIETVAKHMVPWIKGSIETERTGQKALFASA